MVNAAPDNNETNNEAEVVGEVTPEAPAPVETERVRLPMQLSRLPADKLLKVHQALVELEEAGLSEVPDLAHLSKVVKKKTASANNSRLPDEEYTSSYMAMSLWSWTPKRWFENIKSQGKAAGGEAEAGNDAEDQLPALDLPVLEQKLAERIAKIEKENEKKRAQHRNSEVVDVDRLRQWFEKMKESDAEIRSFISLEQKQVGDGVGVLFEKLSSAGGPRVLPKVNTAGFKGEPGAGSEGPLKPNPTPSVVHLHLGVEACTAAQTIWRRYFDDHMLDGSARPKASDGFYGSSTLFASSTTGRYIPRAVLASYDQGTMDLLGEAGMFNPTSLLASSSPGAFAACSRRCGTLVRLTGGGFSSGQAHGEFNDEIMECIRRQVEEADYVEGFLVAHNAIEDVCTNGLTSSLLQKICGDFGKKLKFTFTGMGDCNGDDMATHANAAFMLSSMMEYTDISAFYDRKSLAKIAAAKVNGLGISPDDLTLNGLVARLIGGVTGPMRFGKSISCSTGFRSGSLQSLATNLASYPRIKFVASRLGGLTAKGMEDFAVGKPNQEVGADACSHALKRGSLCSFDPKMGRIIAYSMCCRGVELSSAVAKVADVKSSRDFEFVDWCPSGFSIYCYKDPKVTSPEVAVLENTTAVKAYIACAGDSLAEHRSAFAGEEDGLMSEMIEEIAALGKDYEEVAAETCEDEGEEDYGEEF